MNYDDLESFRIDASSWTKGVNSWPELYDGGLSPDSYNFDINLEPGVLAPAEEPTDAFLTAGLPPYGILASTLVQDNFRDLDPVCVMGDGTVNSDGSYYEVQNNGDMTKIGSTDTGNDYAPRIVDMEYYKSHVYTTTDEDITKQDFDLTSRDLSWWQTTEGQSALTPYVPHPMEVYSDILYIADGQYLHQNDNGTIQTQVFDLGSEWTIRDIQEYAGNLYISATKYFSESFSGREGNSFVFKWNGFAISALNKFKVDEPINVLTVFDNVLFGFCNNYLKWFDGKKFNDLKDLNEPVSFADVASSDSSLFFLDAPASDNGQFPPKYNIMRYATPSFGSQKVFSHCFRPSSLTQNDDGFNGLISYFDSRVFTTRQGSSNATNLTFFTMKTGDGGGSADMYVEFNPRFVRRPIKVRGVNINLFDPAFGGDEVSLKIRDHSRTVHDIKTWDGNDSNVNGVYSLEVDNISIPATNMIQPIIETKGGPSIHSIDVYYEQSETKLIR